jgi:16S rRNA processing protein RimM
MVMVRNPIRNPVTPRIVLGEIVGPHGLRGEVRVRVVADSADPLLEAEALWVGADPGDPEARRLPVAEAGSGRGGEVRIRFEGFRTREAVAELAGLLAMVSPAQLPALPPGEFYWYELIGCRVESETGASAGTVREIWETGAHDVLVVVDEAGVRRLVPTAAELMKHVDLEEGRIVVSDLPGLLEPA